MVAAADMFCEYALEIGSEVLNKEYRSTSELLREANMRLDRVERNLLLLDELCDRIENCQSVRIIEA